MWIQLMKIKYVAIWSLIIVLALCDQQPLESTDVNNQQVNQELSIQQQFKNQRDNELEEWIQSQNDWNGQYPQIQPQQSFVFKLPIESQYDFRIKSIPSTSKLISVSLFLAESGQDITIPQNPTEQSYVEVFTRNSKSGLQQSQGLVYIEKVIQLSFTTSYKYLKIVNNVPTDVLVVVNIQQNDFTIDSKVSDDRFYIAKTKLQTIKKQLQGTQNNRQHMFKWQWGFYDKRQRHERDMLQLTGAQLFAIIVTSIVQMYCIKSLIGHQLVV